jgi:peptidoglycan/LPS O-acetylase OafA/YrhL
LKFRKDINGLRAIAVIAVVLFHFNAEWLPGGFVGVDIFFVISGFLMTSIIFSGLKNETFSLASFYLARAKRIIPALAVMCTVLMIYSWFYLSPLDYEAVGKHVASSITFLSNIIYWQEAGYFDAESSDKWLLHTWSLSVEWQFYLLYPLALLLLKKILTIKQLSSIILIGMFLGFFLNLYITSKAPSMGFYLLFPRAWEMMLGGVAFLYPIRTGEKVSKLIEASGLLMICYSIFFITEHHLWPGYWAAIPVVGTFLIIASNRQSSFFTHNTAFQKIGVWSYSIYLWHWPLVVWYAKHDVSTSPYSGIALSIILGWFSYQIIESNKSIGNSKITSLIAYTSILTASIYCYQSLGFSNLRLNSQEEVKLEKSLEAISDWNYPPADDHFENAKIRTIESDNTSNSTPNLFIGDSLIEQYYPKVQQLVNDGKMPTTYFFTQPGCMPLKGMSRPKKVCDKLPKVTKYLNDKKFNAIYIGGYWDHYLDNKSPYKLGDLSFANEDDRAEIGSHILSLLKQFKQHADAVYFLLPTPHQEEFNPKFMVELDNINTPDKRIHVSEVRTQYSEFYNFINPIVTELNITSIDPIPWL